MFRATVVQQYLYLHSTGCDELSSCVSAVAVTMLTRFLLTPATFRRPVFVCRCCCCTLSRLSLNGVLGNNIVPEHSLPFGRREGNSGKGTKRASGKELPQGHLGVGNGCHWCCDRASATGPFMLNPSNMRTDDVVWPEGSFPCVWKQWQNNCC